MNEPIACCWVGVRLVTVELFDPVPIPLPDVLLVPDREFKALRINDWNPPAGEAEPEPVADALAPDDWAVLPI
jgi:hypothetical protein